MDKIFVDRLAATLGYLIEALDYTDNPDLESKVSQSLDFLGRMIMGGNSMSRYFAVSEQQWRGRAGLSDYAYTGSLFARAAVRFQNPRVRADGDGVLLPPRGRRHVV